MLLAMLATLLKVTLVMFPAARAMFPAWLDPSGTFVPAWRNNKVPANPCVPAAAPEPVTAYPNIARPRCRDDLNNGVRRWILGDHNRTRR
jgi:hypothetical protein